MKKSLEEHCPGNKGTGNVVIDCTFFCAMAHFSVQWRTKKIALIRTREDGQSQEEEQRERLLEKSPTGGLSAVS